MLPEGWILLGFVDCFVWKTLCAPWNSVVVNLMQTILRLFWSWLLKCCCLQVFALVALCFIRLWASAFYLGRSLKSISVGSSQCFLTVKSAHDSFMFGGDFCTASFCRKALFESASYDSDMKTSARLDICAE